MAMNMNMNMNISLSLQEALESSAVVGAKEGEALRKELLKIARTSLGSKILAQHREHFATLAVDAVLRLKVKPAGFPGFLLYSRRFYPDY